MNAAVRYYSRSGNTKAMAEAIARGAGTEAVSVDAADAALQEPVDVLFVGGALYAYGIDKHLETYIQTLDGTQVERAVIFSTTWLSRHSIDLIRKGLKARGIEAAEETFYVRGKPNGKQLAELEAFARRQLQRG